MNFLKKSIIFLICIFLTSLFIILVLYDDIDACLDSGYCKEGLELNTENGKIIVNEQTCKENNGSWISNKNVCSFK